MQSLVLGLGLALLTGCGPIAGAIIVAVESGGGGSSGGGGGGAPPPPGQPGPGPTQPPPDDPLASIQLAASTQEDVPLNVQVPTTTPDGDPLSYTLQSSPSAGSISGQPPNFVYTPFPNWHGSDRVTYRISAGGQSAQAVVEITVASVNDPPNASSLGLELPENSALPITLQGSDVDGDPLGFEVLTLPSNGSISGTGATRVYTPNPNYTGPDSFTYRAVDPQGGLSLAASVQLDVRAQLRLTSVTPDRGDLKGGTRLTITGARFTPTTQVTVAGAPATGVAVLDSTTIECTTDGGPLGYASVELSDTGLYPATSASDAFFYEGWEDPRVNLIQAPGGDADSYWPSLVVMPGGTLACAWLDRRQGLSNLEIRFATSADGGLTWSPSIALVPGPTQVLSGPILAVSPDGVLGCVWQNSRNVRYMRSHDGGTTWSPSLRLDGRDGLKDRVSLVMGAGGTVTCAWGDFQSGVEKVRFTRSTDWGISWTADVPIEATPTSSDQQSPFLALTSTGLACIYSEQLRNGPGDVTAGRLVFAHTVDGGVNWTFARVDDDPDAPPTHKLEPVLVEVSGVLHSVWRSERSSSLRAARSVDGGASWSSSQVLVQGASYQKPNLATNGAGALVCCWQQVEPADAGNVLSARSLDGGITWSAPVRADDEPGNELQHEPALGALPGGSFVCVWADARRGNLDLRHASSSDAGLTWPASGRLDDDETQTSLQYDTTVAFEADGSILAAWRDYRNEETDIYLTRSLDGGASWEPNQLLGLPDPNDWEDAGQPALVVDPSGAWVAAWSRTGGSLGTSRAVVLRRSTDRGVTWSNEVTVNPGTLNGWSPTLTLDPAGGLICTWIEGGTPDGLAVATSSDGGLSWSAPRPLPTVDAVVDHSFAAGPAVWYCAWVEDGAGADAMVVGRSVDRGQTWSRSVRSAGSGSGDPQRVSLAREPGGNYSLAWADGVGIYYIRGDTLGNWTNAVVLSPALAASDLGVAVEPGGTIVVAWDARALGFDNPLHVTRSLDGAATWTPVTSIRYPIPPPWFTEEQNYFTDLEIGPNGQIVIVADFTDYPHDPIFVRGWFRP